MPNLALADRGMNPTNKGGSMSTLLKRLWKDESAQGMTEYILLLVVVVGLILLFKDKIKEVVAGKITQLGTDINSVTSQ